MTTARKPQRTVFACQECGYENPKWLGRCPDCSYWNSFVEKTADQRPGAAAPTVPPQELSRLPQEEEPRLAFGLPEFDRVLGGGAVPGSLALIGGDPGIVKSTLLLQVASLAAGGRTVLYLSGD